MDEKFIKDIENQNVQDLYNTYNEIIATIKSLNANIKEIPTKEEAEDNAK